MGEAQVTSRVTMAATPAEARDELSLATRPDFARCLAEVYRAELERSLEAGSAIEDIRADRVPVEPLADGLVAHRLTVTTSSPRGSATFYADVFLMLAGRAEVSVNFVSRGQPVPAEDRLHHLQVDVAQALDQAGGRALVGRGGHGIRAGDAAGRRLRFPGRRRPARAFRCSRRSRPPRRGGPAGSPRRTRRCGPCRRRRRASRTPCRRPPRRCGRA
jgi:hypothetical protein